MFPGLRTHPALHVRPRTTAKWLPSCPTLCDPMDCGQTGSSVHGILQAKILR